MQNIPTQIHSTVPTRMDIYAGIHKALRAFMCDTLTKVSRMDTDDEEDVREALEQVAALADFCLGHLQHENEFVHSAMEARRPGSANATAEDHVHHQHACAQLHRLAKDVQRATDDERTQAAKRLQAYLAEFVGENFLHMNVEESENNAVLQGAYTDDELRALHGAIVASLPPEEMAIGMRWMIPSFTHAERVEMLRGMRNQAPPPVFDRAVAIARAHLSSRDWDKLARALQLPQPLAA
jgi:hemerythrin-like domain-containing protein